MNEVTSYVLDIFALVGSIVAVVMVMILFAIAMLLVWQMFCDLIEIRRIDKTIHHKMHKVVVDAGEAKLSNTAQQREVSHERRL